MELKIKREITKRVEEEVKVELEPYWVVRIIRQGVNEKKCVCEKEFEDFPTAEDIAYALYPYLERNCFATVVQNHRLVEVEE